MRWVWWIGRCGYVPKSEAVPLGQLDDVWNVTTIRNQTREPIKRQNDLFNTDGVTVVVIPDARQPHNARIGPIQVQLRPFLYGRNAGALRDHSGERHGSRSRLFGSVQHMGEDSGA
jgi:hypothetical protein